MACRILAATQEMKLKRNLQTCCQHGQQTAIVSTHQRHDGTKNHSAAMVCGIFATAMHLRPGRRKQGQQQTHVLAKFCTARHVTSRHYSADPMQGVQKEVAEVAKVAPNFFAAEKSYAPSLRLSSRERASNNLRSRNSHKNYENEICSCTRRCCRQSWAHPRSRCGAR